MIQLSETETRWEDAKSPEQATDKILGLYCLVLVIIGTILNIFGLRICMSASLRRVPCFVYMSFVLLADTFSLYFWCLDGFLSEFFQYRIETDSILSCKFGSFVQYASLQFSSWSLIAFSLTYLAKSIKRPMVINSSPIRNSVLSAFIIVIYNLNVIYFNGYIDLVGTTYKIRCHFSSAFPKWPRIWAVVRLGRTFIHFSLKGF